MEDTTAPARELPTKAELAEALTNMIYLRGGPSKAGSRLLAQDIVDWLQSNRLLVELES